MSCVVEYIHRSIWHGGGQLADHCGGCVEVERGACGVYVCRHTTMERWRPIILLLLEGGMGGVRRQGRMRGTPRVLWGELRRTPHHLRYTAYTTQDGRRASVD